MLNKICQACSGKNRVIKTREEKCTVCQGMGRDMKNPGLGACMECQGTGRVRIYQWFLCQSCHGNSPKNLAKF